MVENYWSLLINMSKTRRILKFEKLSTLAMKNALRLHFDSILLFKNESIPSAFHLAVLALEEISKSDWIEHYVSVSESNFGLPEPDGDVEQEWVKLLYLHTKKQFAFVMMQYHELAPSFFKFVQDNKLEHKKQKSIYVGFEKIKKNINTRSKISSPSQIKTKDAKQIISLNNEVLIDHCKRNIINDFEYGTFDKYELLNENMMTSLKSQWIYKSGIYGNKFISKI